MSLVSATAPTRPTARACGAKAPASTRPVRAYRDPGGVVSGTYETEQEAHAASLYALQGCKQDMRSMNLAELAEECSGLQLGSYDRRVIEWLAGWEPSTVAVICGLIIRARQAGPQ